MNENTASVSVPQCPACSGTDLSAGKVFVPGGMVASLSCVTFKPAANWIEAHYLDAVACLGCGVVTLMLSEDDLAKLRAAARK